MIIIRSLEELYQDQTNLGPVVKALLDNDLDPTEVQDALFEWRDNFLRSKAEEIQVLQLQVNELETSPEESQ